MKYRFLCFVSFGVLLHIPFVYAQWVPHPSPTTYTIRDMQFLNSAHGFLCGTDGIFRTLDGGDTWSKIRFTSFDSIYMNGCDFYAIHFFNPVEGVAAGWNFWDNAAIIIRTGDAGVSWTINSLSPFGTGLFDMEFYNSTNGIAVGKDGRILATTNGGVSWSGRSSGTTSNLYSVAYKNANEIFAVGEQVITKSTNGGSSWSAQQYPSKSIGSVYFLNATTGFAAGAAGLVMEYDAGSGSFVQVPTVFSHTLTDIEFVSSDTGFMATGGYIMKTADGGQLWEEQPAPGGSTLEFIGPNTGFAAGGNGVMSKTTNGGGITYPAAAFTKSPGPYCPGDTVVFTNLNPANYTFTWRLNNQPFATTPHTQLILPDSGVSYFIDLIAFNGAAYDTAGAQQVYTSLLNDIIIDVGVHYDTICPNTANAVYVYNSSSNRLYTCYVGGNSRGSKMGNGATINWTTGNIMTTSDVYVIVVRNTDCEVKRDTGFSQIFVASPKTNLPFFLSDTLICENESIVVSLPNSEPGVRYGVGGVGNVPAQYGNGSQLNFNSNKIAADVTITITATSPFGCVLQFPQLGRVDVRELTVDFETEFSDHYVDSALSFTNASDADSYLWTFQPDATPATDTSHTPEVSFSTTGVKTITLVGNTVEGCTDTLVKNIHLFEIADTATGSVCFYDTIKRTGFNTQVFDYHVDRWGNSYIAGFYSYGGACAGNYSGAQIFYLRKHDSHGNLKWEKSLDACNHAVYRNDEYYSSFITGIDTDTSGNVYVTGSFASCHFVMDHINFWVTDCHDYNVHIQFFAMKLDTSGVPLWMIRNDRTNASGVVGGTDIVYVDDEHIYISVYGNAIRSYSQMIFADSLVLGAGTISGDNMILQINSEGQYKQLFPYMGDVTGLFQYSMAGTWNNKYGTISPKMKVAPDGKIYLVGAGSPDFGAFPTLSNYGFVAILDTASGWVNAFSTYQCLQNTLACYGDRTLNYIPTFTIDQSGAVYIAFEYDLYSVFYPPITSPCPAMNVSFPGIPNVNTREQGSFIAKFDPSGTLVWYNEGSFFEPKSLAMSVEEDEIIIYGDNHSFVGMSSQGKPPVARKSAGMIDVFLMSMSPDGDVNWIKSMGDSLNEFAHFMERGECNNIFYFTGLEAELYLGPTFLQKFDLNNTCREDSCVPVLPLSFISGTIRSPLGNGIKSVVLDATGTGGDYTGYTGIDGRYSLALPTDESYTVTPGKNNDLTTNNGVSLIDALLIRRHVIGGQPLSSPYQIIAADVNGSGTVTNADNLLVRALILQNISSFPGDRLWRFVPHDFVFTNPSNPFPHDSMRYYANVTALGNQDYIGMKLGDVNNSWDPNIQKNDVYSGAVILKIECPVAKDGEITIAIKAKQFKDVSGMQFSLTWDKMKAEYLGAASAALYPEFALHMKDEGVLGVLWTDQQAGGTDLKEDEVLFSLRFKLNDANANCDLRITSDLIPLEAANGNLELLELSEWKEPNTDLHGQPAKYRIYGNYPNPFNDNTFFNFELPETELVRITVFDLLGGKVMESAQVFEAGKHTVELNGNSLPAGIYYLRFKTDSYSQALKMIRLDH